MAKNSLSLNGKAILLDKMASEYCGFVEKDLPCPRRQTFQIVSREENLSIGRNARIAAMDKLNQKSIVKVAFDTRRVNQEESRNPRTNLQYWHRSDPFIDTEDEKKLATFAKLMKCLTAIKNDLGTQPEWFESYARVLYDNVHRILRIKQADLDIFKPQINYLEQLIYARYRISMNELESISENDLRSKILAKDESLLKRGNYLKETGLEKASNSSSNIVIDGKGATTQESIVNAIFGDVGLRRDGERVVTRTITITIRDEAGD